MKRIITLLLVVGLGYPVLAYPDEKQVIRALESIKAHLESGVNQSELKKLLADAKVEINIAAHDKTVSKDFIDLAKECRSSYAWAQTQLELANRFQRLNAESEATTCELEAQKAFKQAAQQLEKLYGLLIKKRKKQ